MHGCAVERSSAVYAWQSFDDAEMDYMQLCVLSGISCLRIPSLNFSDHIFVASFY